MPLQSQALGATVAEVTAQPSKEVGVDFVKVAVVTATGLKEVGGGVALGLFSGQEGEGGWLYGLNDPPPWGVRPSCASMPSVRTGCREGPRNGQSGWWAGQEAKGMRTVWVPTCRIGLTVHRRASRRGREGRKAGAHGVLGRTPPS